MITGLVFKCKSYANFGQFINNNFRVTTVFIFFKLKTEPGLHAHEVNS